MENTSFNATKRTDIYQIDPRRIVVVEGFNARRDFDVDELAESIARHGMLNPVTVVPFKDDNNEEWYRLVDGERRYKAVMKKLADGMDIRRIKAIFLPKTTKEEDMYIQQMTRNEGKTFTDYEQAIFYRSFMDKFGYTQSEVAEKFCKNRGVISRCLNLLELPTEIQDKLEKGEISTEAVRNIVNSNKENEKAQIDAVNQAVTTAKKSGKKTATTKNVSPTIQLANLIKKVRKDALKIATMCDSIDNPVLVGMKKFFTDFNEQTSEMEYISQHLDDTIVEPSDNVAPISDFEDDDFGYDSEFDGFADIDINDVA